MRAYRYIASNIPGPRSASLVSTAQDQSTNRGPLAAPTASTTMEMFENLLKWRRLPRAPTLAGQQSDNYLTLQAKVISYLPIIKAHWGVLEHEDFIDVSPLPDHGTRVAINFLLTSPFQQHFADRPADIGCGHRDDAFDTYISYVNTVMSAWYTYFSLGDLPVEWKKFYDGLSRDAPVHLPTSALEYAGERLPEHSRQAFADGLGERMLFALLIPHPNEMPSGPSLVLHHLPAEGMVEKFHEHAKKYDSGLCEVRISCFQCPLQS